MSDLDVLTAGPSHANELATFAEQRPLVRADFASIAALQPDEPRVVIARDPATETVVAAAIDDGLAMSVGGSDEGLDAIAATIAQIDSKLVIAGPIAEVRRVVQSTTEPRRERLERFMAIKRDGLLVPYEAIPLRIATEDDLPILRAARVAALEEEYGIPVPEGSTLRTDLMAAVTRAVALQGVAIWVEDDACAFTAQLIAKTPEAAMFGDLFVDPRLRGEGRATRALAAFCTWLMSESDHVTLRVGSNNESAVRLYERVGFEDVDVFCSSLGSAAPGISTEVDA